MYSASASSFLNIIVGGCKWENFWQCIPESKMIKGVQMLFDHPNISFKHSALSLVQSKGNSSWPTV